jgi:hypothetical protein
VWWMESESSRRTLPAAAAATRVAHVNMAVVYFIMITF